MTSIAAPAVQTAVAHIVARILERAPQGGTDTPPPSASPSAPERPAPGQPGRAAAAGRPGIAAGQGRPGAQGTSNQAPSNQGTSNPSTPTVPDGQSAGSNDGNSGAATPAGGTSVILSALLSLASRALPMDILNSNPLPNLPQQGALLKSPLTQLPPELLAKPGVIEAVVLRNTLLPNSPGQQPQPSNPLLPVPGGDTATQLPTNYRIALQWQNRVLQFISPEPLPTGRTVQLQIDARGQVMLLPAATPQARIAAALLTSNSALANPAHTGNTAGSAQTTLTQTAATQNTARIAQVAQAQLPSALLKTTPQETLQQSLRETLPRQQALNTLVPLLQKLLSPNARAQLPEPVAKQLTQLLQSLPKPAQLQTGDGVKRALENSGSFLEARIVKSALAPPAGTNPADAPEPVAKVLETDLKAQLTTLLGIVRKLLPNETAMTQTAIAGDKDAALESEELVYDPKLLRRNTNAAPNGDEIDAGDLQLAQLSKLLQSGLARIQMNQLDGAVSRHANADPQLQVPAWVLELPLANRNGHSDHLQLRIEQHAGNQQHTQKRVQWNVQISFDLHALGKIAAQLAIVERNVSATVWAEQANTHRSVQDKIDYLRAGLESVGVKVTEMQCRHGLPPERAALISQQLVDVHT